MYGSTTLKMHNLIIFIEILAFIGLIIRLSIYVNYKIVFIFDFSSEILLNNIFIIIFLKHFSFKVINCFSTQI